MSGDLIEIILVYSSIPAFLGVLLVLLYFIIRSQYHFSFREEGKKALKHAVKRQKTALAFPAPIYLLTLLFVVCVIVLASVMKRKS